MSTGIMDDLLGTLKNKFKISIGGPQIKANSGVVEARNSADSAYAKLRGSSVDVEDDSANLLTLDAIANLGGNVTLRFPAKGTDGQVLRQKAGTGAGIIELEWASAASVSDKESTDTTTLPFNASSPVTMFTLPANAVVKAVRVIVDTAFDGTPQVTVGISGTVSKYMGATENDLTAAAGTVFQVHPGLEAEAGTEDLIATYTQGSATAGSARIEVDYAVPS